MKNFILLVSLFFFFCSFSQEQKKDTLFIEYDNDLLTKYKEPIDNYSYYLIKDSETCETISFVEEQTYLDLKPKSIFYLKSIIKKAGAYHTKNKYKKGKIDDCKLANYLGKFAVFFKKGSSFIKVGIHLTLDE